ncbi:MAG: tetratricopeptide repeat protein, partial [Acidobacteria bacterium]|nr:tetratricopeptide repeat protein [Acidobacteriota bacterium]
MATVLVLLVSSAALPKSSAGAEQPQLDQEFRAALAQYNAGNFIGAAERLERLSRVAPANFPVEELLGMAYSSRSEDRKAAVHFEAAVELNPTSAAARTNLATTLAHLGKLAQAEAEFKKALELDPGSFDSNHNLGEFYVAAAQIEKAIAFLEKAQRIKPEAYENGYDLSLAYLETGLAAQARETVEHLMLQRNTAELHNLLGEIHEKQGNFVPAEREYETAAHMDPSESNLFDWASELLLHRTLDPAVEVFENAQARYPNSARLTIGLGMALYSRGNYDDAVKALLKAADLSPRDPGCYYFLSKAYDSSPSQAAEVIKRFRRFRELEPKEARAHYYYAMSLWKGKRAADTSLDVRQIELELKRSVELDPKFADAHFELGNLNRA